MTCNHATPANPGVVSCALGQYGGTPAASLCRGCPHYDGPARGAGDLIVSAIRAIKPSHTPCGKCQQRREALNRVTGGD